MSKEIPEGVLDGEIIVEDNAEDDNPEIIPCPNCGRPTHRTCLMNGGSCCSECYDSMDEEY